MLFNSDDPETWRYSIKVISYSPRNRNKGRVSPLRDEKEMDRLTASLIRDSRWHAKIRFFLVTSFHDELKVVVCVSAEYTRSKRQKSLRAFDRHLD